MQAIRYTYASSELLEGGKMETASARRKRKLIWLVGNHGGLAAVAAKAELSAAALDQVIKGVKPANMKAPKGLGNKAARKLEHAFKLGTGWFDTDAETAPQISFGDLNAFEAQLVTFFRQLSPEVQHEVLTSLNSMLPKTKRASAHDPFPGQRPVRGMSIFDTLQETKRSSK